MANAASALGMEVYGYDPYISIDAAWNLSRTIKHIKSLDEIYSQCDYITIHVPLLDSTKEMINKEALDKMKDGVVLLNFARDLLVDEDALIEALDNGKVKKYVTDFANHTVAGHKGILVTPHLGASTEESEENCAVMAVKEVRDFLENGNIKNSVNFPNCDMGTCVAVGLPQKYPEHDQPVHQDPWCRRPEHRRYDKQEQRRIRLYSHRSGKHSIQRSTG